MRFAVVPLAVTLALVPRAAHAYRPFDGTDGDTAEEGEIELEIGPAQAIRGLGETTYEPGFVFNYGFAKGFELVIDADGAGIPLANAPSNSRFLTDVQVKHVLREGILQDKTGPSIALETGPLLPTLPHDSGDGDGWDAGLIISYRWPVATVHLNFEGLYTRDRELGGWTSAIIEGPFDWNVRPVSELLVEHDQDGTSVASALAGVLWRVSDKVVVDAAGRVEHTLGADALEVRAGVTWSFGS